MRQSTLEEFQHGNPTVVLAHLDAIQGNELQRIRRKPAYIQAVAAGLQHENRRVRRAAVEALGRIGKKAAPYAKAIVEHALQHEKPEVRQAAAEALGLIGKPALRELEKMLRKEKDGKAKKSIQEAIGFIKRL